MSKHLPAKIHIPEIDADFLLIPAGAFYVGEKKKDIYGGEKEHRRLAAITTPFYMQETPVTHRQYQSLTWSKPAKFKDKSDHPVKQVSWNASVDFAEKLSRLTRLAIRLPTEMEWEYAARGGDGDKYRYSGSNNINEVAWYYNNSNQQTQPVKQKKPNGYGLYDMTGNVSEWCFDQYSEIYPNQELIDYRGSKSEHSRVFRGGSWSDVRTPIVYRYRLDPGNRFDNLGFRLVLEAPHV